MKAKQNKKKKYVAEIIKPSYETFTDAFIYLQ